CSVAGAADAPRRFEKSHRVSEAAIQPLDPLGGLVDEHHGSMMPGEERRRSLLIGPGESAARVLPEFDVIRRAGVDEIPIVETKILQIDAAEVPARQHRLVRAEVVEIMDAPVAAERDVESAFTIEAAESVVSGPIQEIEQRGRFSRVTFAFRQEGV